MNNDANKHILARLSAFGVGLACALVAPGSASATTLASTKLSDVTAMSTAVVQGVLKNTTNLVDGQGVPWTIYNLAVEKVLAGKVAETSLSFRCVGGTVGERTLVLSGTPRLAVGDSIVTFLHQDGLCQVSGLEYGVFWKRTDAAGIERLVDYRGRVLAAMGGDNIVLSGEVVDSGRVENVPETHTTNADHEDPDVEAGRAPAATADAILGEIEAFSKAYLTKPEALRSTVDLKGIPTLDQSKAPVAATAEVQK